MAAAREDPATARRAWGKYEHRSFPWVDLVALGPAEVLITRAVTAPGRRPLAGSALPASGSGEIEPEPAAGHQRVELSCFGLRSDCGAAIPFLQRQTARCTRGYVARRRLGQPGPSSARPGGRAACTQIRVVLGAAERVAEAPARTWSRG